MDKLSFFYKYYVVSNPYYGFDRGIFSKWGAMQRPYMPKGVSANITESIRHSVTLNMDAWVYSFSIKIKKEAEYAQKGKKIRVENYPACAVACYKGDINIIALNYTRPKTKKEDDRLQFHDAMIELFKDRLKVVPYHKTKQCQFPAGHCAEQRAANDMIGHSACEVSDLRFSVAFRPRTMEYIPACINCKTLFGL